MEHQVSHDWITCYNHVSACNNHVYPCSIHFSSCRIMSYYDKSCQIKSNYEKSCRIVCHNRQFIDMRQMIILMLVTENKVFFNQHISLLMLTAHCSSACSDGLYCHLIRERERERLLESLIEELR